MHEYNIMQEAASLKEEGNREFKAGRYEAALRSYTEGLSAVTAACPQVRNTGGDLNMLDSMALAFDCAWTAASRSVVALFTPCFKRPLSPSAVPNADSSAGLPACLRCSLCLATGRSVGFAWMSRCQLCRTLWLPFCWAASRPSRPRHTTGGDAWRFSALRHSVWGHRLPETKCREKNLRRCEVFLCACRQATALLQFQWLESAKWTLDTALVAEPDNKDLRTLSQQVMMHLLCICSS